MKITKKALQRIIKEELSKVLKEAYVSPKQGEFDTGSHSKETDDEFKIRKGGAIKKSMAQNKKASLEKDYKPSNAASFAHSMAMEAAKALGYVDRDGVTMKITPNYSIQKNRFETAIEVGGDTILTTYETPETMDRQLAVDASTQDPALQKKMVEILGTSPRFGINFQ